MCINRSSNADNKYPTEQRQPDAPGIREALALGEMHRTRNVFAFEAPIIATGGDRMLSGKYVLVEDPGTARQGDLVLGFVRNIGTFLTRFVLDVDLIRLRPIGTDMQPIVVLVDQFVIKGTVLGAIRDYREGSI